MLKVWLIQMFLLCYFKSSYGYLNKPRLVLHVGPHKTGSSYIQNALLMCKHQLEIFNYHLFGKQKASDYHPKFWPSIIERVHLSMNKTLKSKNETCYYFNNFPFISDLKALADFYASNNMNVILSAETLSDINQDLLACFLDLFAKFDVTVIMFYRESISRLISLYSQQVYQASTVLFHNITKQIHINVKFQIEFYKNLYSNFAKYVGSTNIITVDYEGMKSLDRNPLSIIVCDIIGILCNSIETIVKTLQVDRNEKMFMDVHSIMDRFSAYMQVTYGFKMNDDRRSRVRLITALNSMLAKTNYTRAQIRSDLDMNYLCGMSTQVDTLVRELAGPRMLYGNVSANREVCRAASIYELDEEAFDQDEFWSAWLIQANNAETRASFHNCTLN